MHGADEGLLSTKKLSAVCLVAQQTLFSCVIQHANVNLEPDKVNFLFNWLFCFPKHVSRIHELWVDLVRCIIAFADNKYLGRFIP